jgi:hypothetical protein
VPSLNSHFRVVLVDVLVEFRERVDGRRWYRPQVILELEDGLAIAGHVHLIVGVLEYVDLVLVGEDTRGRLAHAEALLGDVALAEVAARKLSRGHGEGLARQLVQVRARLRGLLLLRLVRQPVHDLVVQDVEAHGRQGHAGHYVAGAKPDGKIARLEGVVARIGARYHVTEAYRTQAHEAKVARI